MSQMLANFIPIVGQPSTQDEQIALARRLILVSGNCRMVWLPPARDASFPSVKRGSTLGGGFRMGVAGWRFASKTNNNGRAVVIAILETRPAICSVTVAAGAMIMVAAMLYNDFAAAQ